ncbi:MAG: phosphonate metabolism protein/1,5-bisphosphokinase (PRPP-forming) PhnN [Pseudomonadota bacterium]|nr:phosphonate metabolism protein/1,5-bisphosphokinase (PRPP-forming) PhnN [Pseudomonadota bacterium]
MPKSGQLFYLIGASGAGKDSLIRYARQHLTKPKSIKFAKRYITRPTDPKSDGNHHAIELAKFDRLLKNDYFAMHWNRHGCRYGISKEIDTWLDEGRGVVINGSRQYLPQALRDYPGLHAILVQADHDLLRERLQARRRDNPANIEERMQSAKDFIKLENQTETFTIINNNGPLKLAGKEFLAILQAR